MWSSPPAPGRPQPCVVGFSTSAASHGGQTTTPTPSAASAPSNTADRRDHDRRSGGTGQLDPKAARPKPDEGRRKPAMRKPQKWTKPNRRDKLGPGPATKPNAHGLRIRRQGCTAHADCDGDQYCDSANTCFSCPGCTQYDDAITGPGTCPANCQAALTTPSGGRTTPSGGSDDGDDSAGCSAHSDCSSSQYCDSANTCYSCPGCTQYDDAITGPGTCPANCAGEGCSAHSECEAGDYCDQEGSCYTCDCKREPY